MQKKQLLWLAPIALAAAWVYALGRSADGLRTLLDSAVADSAVTGAEPSTPLAAASPRHGDEERAVESPPIARTERRPAPAPREIAPLYAEPPPAVYADNGSAVPADSAEPIEHPEVTDPHMRKLLQAAWDD